MGKQKQKQVYSPVFYYNFLFKSIPWELGREHIDIEQLARLYRLYKSCTLHPDQVASLSPLINELLHYIWFDYPELLEDPKPRN